VAKRSVKKVMVDLDGCLCDFVLAFTELGAEMHGTKVLATGTHASWGFEDTMSRKQINSVWGEVKNRPDFWAHAKCLLTSEEGDQLFHNYRDHDMVFVTSRVGSRVVYQTSLWLERHFSISHPSILVSSRKGEIARAIDADFSIEDKLENAWVIHWLTDGKTKSYILDQPYNRISDVPSIGAHAVKRVKTLTEFFEEVNDGS